MNMKRTKIVCTIGPASRDPAIISKLIESGMDVARLNFSHGTREEHLETLSVIRHAAKLAGRPIAVLGDLQGPKIRLGVLPKAGVEIVADKEIVFSTASDSYMKGILPVTYRKLHLDVKPGHRILLDDGLCEVKIVSVKGRLIRAKVINGGKLTSHKGMNFPDSTLGLSSLTEKDREDIIFGVKIGVDWMALSFAKSANDVHLLRRLIKRAGKKNRILPRIIVKIEKHEAIDHFDDILCATDGIMVARGDLGVEIPADQVPIFQKEMIEKCRKAGKPVVVATQMLDSMIRNPRPTRAEVSDVANAVFDHTDAVMLSGETAMGKYPIEAVKMMADIIITAEESPFDNIPLAKYRPMTVCGGMAEMLKDAAFDGQIDGVLVSLKISPWAETLFLEHPEVPLFLASPDDVFARQNNIRWGAEPFTLKGISQKNFVSRSMRILRKNKLVKKGTRLAIVLGDEKVGFKLIEVK